MNWKVLAIISIVINVLFVLFFGWAVSLGMEMEENEAICAINVCSMDESLMYWYDEYTNVCECYNAQEQLIHSEVLQ